MPAAAIAIPAAISLGSSIYSGAKKSSAAKKAGQLQSEEAQRQAQDFRTTLGEWNPQIGQRADLAAEEARGSAGQGANLAMDLAREAQQGLSPYTQLGGETAQTLRDFMAPGGAGQRTFTAADMEAYDPGYQFRLDEAKQALEKSAAARGGLLGGGTAKALAAQQQKLASSEFGAAEQRFRQQQTDRYNRLFGVTELGSRAATQSGQFGTRAGEFAADLGFRGAQSAGQFGTRGVEMQASNALDTQRMISDLMTGGAAAQAAGKVGSANAWGDAMTNIGNTAMWAGSQYQANREGEQDRAVMSQWMNPALRTQPLQTANLYTGGAYTDPRFQAGYYNLMSPDYNAPHGF